MDTRKRPVLRVLNALTACLGVAAGGLAICWLLLACVPTSAAPEAGALEPPAAEEQIPRAEEQVPRAEEPAAPAASGEELEEAAPARMTRRDTYDEAGNLLWSIAYQYDGQGRTSGVACYDAAGTQIGFVEILYDEAGRELQSFGFHYTDGSKIPELVPFLHSYDPSGMTERIDIGDGYFVVYQYDENQRIVQYDHYSADGAITTTSLYTYNPDGTLARIDEYSADGTLYRYSLWIYDGSGNALTCVSYHPDGSEVSRATYAYDENGNCVREDRWERWSQMTTVTLTQYEENGANP